MEYSSGQKVTFLNNYGQSNQFYEFIGWKMVDKCQKDSNYCILADRKCSKKGIFNARLIQVPYNCVKFESLNIKQPWSHPSVRVFKQEKISKLFDIILARKVSGLRDVSFLQVLQEFYSANIPVFIVGGAVGDVVTVANDYKMIDIEQIENIKDIDLGFGESAQTVLELMLKKGWKCSMNRQTGLISIGDKTGIFLEGKSINGLNSDRYTLEIETLVNMGTNLYIDTICRDFTMNSLWYDAMNRVIIDPTRHGLQDTLNKTLRVPVPWEDRMLWVKGNPTKLIRYWKFIARGYQPANKNTREFIIEQATLYGCDENKRKRLECYNQLTFGIKHGNDGAAQKRESEFMAAVVADMGQEWYDMCFR